MYIGLDFFKNSFQAIGPAWMPVAWMYIRTDQLLSSAMNS